MSFTRFYSNLRFKPFLARYYMDSLTLVDHYRYLCQLLPIYEALERAMSISHLDVHLPKKLFSLLTLSKSIKKDLKFLESYVPKDYHNEVTQLAYQYGEYLAYFDPDYNRTYNDDKIFVHYLIRMLSDLIDGQGLVKEQGLKNYIISLYKRENIYSDRDPQRGLSFYTFESGILKHVSSWLNTLLISEETIDKHAKLAYRKIIGIYNELECTRLSRVIKLHDEGSQNQTRNYCNLFTKPILIGSAALTTAALILESYNKLTK